MSDIEKWIFELRKAIRRLDRVMENEHYHKNFSLLVEHRIQMVKENLHKLKKNINKLDENNNTQLLSYLQKLPHLQEFIYHNINNLPIENDIHMISVLERMVSYDKNIIIKHNINKVNILDLLIDFKIDYKIKKIINFTSLFICTLYYVKVNLPKSEIYKTLPKDIRKYL